MLTHVFPFTDATVWARRCQKWIDSRRDWFSNQKIKIRVTEPNFFFCCFFFFVTNRDRENRELKGTIADLLYYILYDIVIIICFPYESKNSINKCSGEILVVAKTKIGHSLFKTPICLQLPTPSFACQFACESSQVFKFTIHRCVQIAL